MSDFPTPQRSALDRYTGQLRWGPVNATVGKVPVGCGVGFGGGEVGECFLRLWNESCELGIFWKFQWLVSKSRWWQLKYFFYEMMQFDEHIFQMGWNETTN